MEFDMSTNPKVSVGIPTYNRPDGVLRTIQQIVAQEYSNIEIIVSNNASPNTIVRPLLDRCAELDPRIRVVHQLENVGIIRNFKFVLSQATGDYFMWAADDDEWDKTFISSCILEHLKRKVGTVMPGFFRHNRALNIKGPAELPKMEGLNRFLDVMEFYRAMPHSIFYGLHRRNTILWFLEGDDALFDDEYFLVRQVLHNGIFTVPEKMLYCAGIEDAQYQIKLPKEAEDRYFFQYMRLLNFGRLIAESNTLNDIEKMKVLQKVLLTKLGFIISFEKGMREESQFLLAHQMYAFLSNFDLDRLGEYAAYLPSVNAIIQKQKQGEGV